MTRGWNRARSGLTGLAALVGLVLLVAAFGGGSGSGAMSSAMAGSSRPARPVAIGTARGQHGTYLTAASGRALYMWVGDSNGASSCSGDCATTWPPLLGTGTPTPGSGVNSEPSAVSGGHSGSSGQMPPRLSMPSAISASGV